MTQSIKFEKVVPEGKALGHWNEKAVFAIGPLPGETAEVTIVREKRTWAEATLRKIVEPSVHRTGETESHYLSCSPWQGVDYAYQCTLKRQMLDEIYAQPELKLDVAEFHSAVETTGYRNKLEFSVYNFDGAFQLAFHERGRFDAYVPAPDGCRLGSESMNTAARGVVDELIRNKLDSHAQTVTVRKSRSNGAVIAVVCVDRQADKLGWSDLTLPDGLQGLRVVTKVKHNFYHTLYNVGSTDLEEIVGGVTMVYPWDSFFQVNLPMFELVLADIRQKVAKGAHVMDLYGGAGSIGLPLARDGHQVVGVEIIASSVKLANANAEAAGLTNYHAICAPAEKISLESFEGIDVVVVDPPRAGLHGDVVQTLLEAAPKRIIYVSCNPITQARDILVMSDKYAVEPVIGYDQYPGTLHLESLVVLNRKAA